MCEQDGICGAGPTGALSEPMRRLFGTSLPSLPIGASADQQGRFLQPFRVLGGGSECPAAMRHIQTRVCLSSVWM